MSYKKILSLVLFAFLLNSCAIKIPASYFVSKDTMVGTNSNEKIAYVKTSLSKEFKKNKFLKHHLESIEEAMNTSVQNSGIFKIDPLRKQYDINANIYKFHLPTVSFGPMPTEVTINYTITKNDSIVFSTKITTDAVNKNSYFSAGNRAYDSTTNTIRLNIEEFLRRLATFFNE